MQTFFLPLHVGLFVLQLSNRDFNIKLEKGESKAPEWELYMYSRLYSYHHTLASICLGLHVDSYTCCV